jgi:hypothetical protein
MSSRVNRGDFTEFDELATAPFKSLVMISWADLPRPLREPAMKWKSTIPVSKGKSGAGAQFENDTESEII